MATYYAAIGTDGIRPVVWGLGETEGAAGTEARIQQAQSVDGDPLNDALVIIEVTAEQSERVTAGVVDLETLGIQLTPVQIRELRA